MKTLATHLPALQVVVPLVGALLSALLRRGTAAWFFALIVSWLMPLISVALIWQVQTSGPISYQLGGWAPPWGIEYRVDLLNAFVLVLVSVVGAAIMPFARRSIAKEIDGDKQAWFYTMYLLCLTGLLGITITGDAFNVFVFLEISSLSTYVLIALGRDRRALLAAYQYLILGTIGATFYIIGVGFLYLVTGSLNIVDIAQRLGTAAVETPRPVMAALAFMAVGVSLKLALFPLHVWLPGAYAHAPSVATAFLAGTATKVAIYVLIRFFFSVFGVAMSFDALPVSEVMLALSLAAMFIASLVAVFEANTKRMLAYSSLAQIGYITLGMSLANTSGLTGGIVHLFNHALMKTTLFLSLGAIAYRIGSVKLADLAGIGRQMPLTMAAFAIGGLAIIGVPGTAGFVSKWYLAVGAVEKGWWPLVFLILASSLIAVVYIGRVVETAWFREPSMLAAKATDPPLSMLIPLLLLAAATIYFGIDTEASAGIARKIASGLVGGLK
ncbi:MAG TPA: monovalent cation/H+ antiporter subunit D family protein [Hyphomicrobiaceae bacterium]|nr:monovalent cation/H+ antiporter subunit D family protein [Hyphomicrobiaceae bacterium]